MLFKVIDPNFILSDTFREWPLETKATYTVICAMANYKTGEFYHSVETVSHHANVCRRAVQRSLRRMEDAGIITLEEKRPGSSSRYRYNFPTQVHKSINKDRDDSAVRDDSTVRGDYGIIPQAQEGDSPVMGGVTEQSSQLRLTSHPIEPENAFQTRMESGVTSTDSTPNKKDLNKQDLTTTYIDKLTSELTGNDEDIVFVNAVVVLNLEGRIDKLNYRFDPG